MSFTNMLISVVGLALVIHCACADQTQLKQCYSCTATDSDSLCQNKPDGLENAILPCARDICTVVRVEEVSTGKVKSFYRGCDQRTAVFSKNHCVIQNEEKTCFSACAGNLCNSADGHVIDSDLTMNPSYHDSNLAPMEHSNSANSGKKFTYTVSAVLIFFPMWVM